MTQTARRRFLILHGVENRRPREHWQRHLAEELRDRGEIVLYPQLPEPDEPRLESWLELLRAEIDQLGRGERIVVCHSLAVLLWLHYANASLGAEPVSRVLLVAPPSPAILWPAISAFAPGKFDREALRGSCRSRIRLVCSDNDPSCPEGAAELFGAPLDLDLDLVRGGGHISVADGFGPWREALEWCLDPATRCAPAASQSARRR